MEHGGIASGHFKTNPFGRVGHLQEQPASVVAPPLHPGAVLIFGNLPEAEGGDCRCAEPRQDGTAETSETPITETVVRAPL